jgi:class 3 adenylate cyclase
MSHVVDDAREAGREAAARGAWTEAYEILVAAEKELQPEDLERLAEAAWWVGRLDESIERREAAYKAWLKEGEKRRAALVAIFISQDLFNKASLERASGWFSNAERLLADEPESVEHGYLAITRALTAMIQGNNDSALSCAERAHELGVRFENRDLQAIALVTLGRTHLLSGNPSEGVRLLDEASAAALSGELQPFSTGLVYCITITSCNGVGDLRRAAEWTKAATRWCSKQDVPGFPGACRIHHSTMLRLNGEWAEAEAEALRACDEVREYDPYATGIGWYEVGEIRRFRGDFAAAEEAYRQAKIWRKEPEPGLSLLRLAQGKVEAAARGIERSLAANESNPVALVRRLTAQVEIALAQGKLRVARSAAEELEKLVDEFRLGDERTPAFEAMVCLSWGRIEMEENDVERAAMHLQKGLDTWQSVGAPYEAAKVRMILGRAFRKLGDEDGARDELEAARAVFVQLGAVLDAQTAAELLGEVPVSRTFVFTDIVESTRLAEALGEEKWQKLLAWHDRTLRALIEEHGGEVIKQTGDGFFAAFERPGDAVEAAVAVQRALDGHDGIAPDVRIGLHAGGAFAKDETDYGGQGVHAAARIGALAGASEILASQETLAGGAAGRHATIDAREVELKGISEPVRVVALDWRS